MASQYSTDISFTASHDQQAFKLLELPPELLTLLESENPPMLESTHLAPLDNRHNSSRLQITSSANATSGPGYATLCYGDKRYQMRQKNTSNPIMILKPSMTQPGDAEDAETSIPSTSITAISKVEDTIELILQEGEAKPPPKVNKWHERFAKGRAGSK